MRPLTLLLSALALALGGLVAAPAAPASAAACSGTSGVTVVINSTSYCAPGDPASGMAALQAVASVVQVQTQPGFVCRVNGAPASDPCVRTPPATAYWSYWHAQPGGSWQYSNLGAASYDPAPGSVEGWSFGSGGQPGIAPPSAPAPAPPAQPDPPPASSAPPAQPAPPAAGGSGTAAPAPGASATSGGTSGGASATASGTARAPGATTDATGPTGPASGAPATTAPSASASATSGAATSTTSAEPSPSGTRETIALASGTRDAGGPPWTAIGGGLLVVALGAAAGVVAWRRRAADAGPGAYGG